MLKIQFRDRRQESVWLVGDQFSIGADSGNDLVVESTQVNPFHAQISQSGDQRLILSDLETEHGTFLNGQKVTEHASLKAGDVIKVGDIELEIIDPKQLAGAGGAPENGARAWSLVSTASWMHNKHFEVENRLVIGRDATCDISAPVEHLSRKHAEVYLQDGKLFVQDLSSANGTFVNGEKVTRAELKPGDRLKLDVITFNVDGPEVSGEEFSDPNKTIVRPSLLAKGDNAAHLTDETIMTSADEIRRVREQFQRASGDERQPSQQQKDILNHPPEGDKSLYVTLAIVLVLIVAITAGVFFLLL